MNFRIKEEIDGEFNKYNLNISFLRAEEIGNLVEQYNNIINSVVLKKKNNLDISNEVEELNKIKNIIKYRQNNKNKKRNILKGTLKSDKRIGHGQDSIVYEFDNNSNYIYKEGKESSKENIEYLKRKYRILKKYLGDVIPKSFFVLGESFSSLPENRWLKDGTYIATKSLTVQRKVKGKDASKMTTEEKRNINFLIQLEEGHKKYVALKLFLDTIINDLNLPKKSMDLQLDLGALSNRDNFHHDEIDFIESKLKSPNIMWDGNKVHFIDFGFGKWDEDKEIIFNELMKDENFGKWEQLLDIYGLK